MQTKWLMSAMSLAVALQFMPSGAQAFECPKHFTAAQAALNGRVGAIKAPLEGGAKVNGPSSRELRRAGWNRVKLGRPFTRVTFSGWFVASLG